MFLHFSFVDCSDSFNDAAIDLSKHVSPEIKTILLNLVKDVNSTKPCFFRGDLDCLKDNLRNVAIVEWKKAEALSTSSELRELIAKLLAKDVEALKRLEKLKDGDIIDATIIICEMFNYKTKLIREYLMKVKKN